MGRKLGAAGAECVHFSWRVASDTIGQMDVSQVVVEQSEPGDVRGV